MKVVWTNGCFDVLHRGHIELFKYAKSLGDKLIVAIDSDIRIRQMKGNLRPVNNEKDRKFFLESISFIDEVVVFDSDKKLRNFINFFEPDVMVVGADYKEKEVIGSEFVKKLIFFNRIEGYSTTSILERAKNE